MLGDEKDSGAPLTMGDEKDSAAAPLCSLSQIV